jgi:selenocysteine-specific elongation factor
VRVLGVDAIPAGGDGFVRVHVRTPLPLLPGDRFVLRESGRSETVGGGEVLDVAPVRPASRAAPDRSVDRVVRERGFVTVDELDVLTGERRAPTLGPWVADPAAVAALRAEVRARVAEAGALGLDVATLDERGRTVLAVLDDVRVADGRARVQEAPDPLADHPFVAVLAAAGFTPPGADAVDRRELRALVQRGLVVERDGCWFHPSVIDAAAVVAAELLAGDPGGFTVAQLRDALGATRKHVLPLANELDARGVTRRRGDVRIAGPRLPTVG